MMASTELWSLDREGDVTVHGTAVVHRDSVGRLVVDTDRRTRPLRQPSEPALARWWAPSQGLPEPQSALAVEQPLALPQARLPGLWRISNAPMLKTRPGLKQASFCSPGSTPSSRT